MFSEKLIDQVKKEVKQLMEESVTRKFVHEESGSVTSLCAAVESCLSQGNFFSHLFFGSCCQLLEVMNLLPEIKKMNTVLDRQIMLSKVVIFSMHPVYVD